MHGQQWEVSEFQCGRRAVLVEDRSRGGVYKSDHVMVFHVKMSLDCVLKMK